MLTVRNAERDKVIALDAGADDFVVKPLGSKNFSLESGPLSGDMSLARRFLRLLPRIWRSILKAGR
jgi:CheY-like chemotaxis protein